MQKFHGLLLTVALSFFTLFLCKFHTDVALKKITPTHKLHDNNSLNSYAISANSSFEELRNFEEYKNQLSVSHFYTNLSLNKFLLDVNSSYLKACDFFNFSLTVRTIIYPFHSFL
jgi:hypothetical protein